MFDVFVFGRFYISALVDRFKLITPCYPRKMEWIRRLMEDRGGVDKKGESRRHNKQVELQEFAGRWREMVREEGGEEII